MSEDYSDEDYDKETHRLLELVRKSGIDRYPCSPPALLALYRRMQQDDRLRRLIEKFSSATSLEQATAEGLDFVERSFSYRVLDHSSINVGICGSRSIGKSEFAMALALKMILLFKQLTGVTVDPDFSRDYASTNTALANAVLDGRYLALIFDEPEKQSGTGTDTEETAFWNNLNTMRILLQNVLKCSPLFDWNFAVHCDFYIEVIFKDRQRKVNYAIVWVIDHMEGRRNPEYVLALPLHADEDLRTRYAAMKEHDQKRLTTQRGRNSRMLDTWEPVADALMQRAIDLTEEGRFNAKSFKGDQRRWHDLQTLLEFDVAKELPMAVGLTGDEKQSICRRAIMLLQDWYSGQYEKPPEPPPEYEWKSDFTWLNEIALLLQSHPDFQDYYPFFLASEVEHLSPATHHVRFNEMTGRGKTQNNKWVARMRKDQKFQGWLKQARSELHEKYLAQRFTHHGWQVESKPEVEVDGARLQEDLFIAKDGREFFINAKCGQGLRTYVSDEYKVTHLIATVVRRPAFILYLDLDEQVHYVYDPAEDWLSVGTGKGCLSSTRNPHSMANPSTPFLSALVPAPQASPQGTAQDTQSPPVTPYAGDPAGGLSRQPTVATSASSDTETSRGPDSRNESHADVELFITAATTLARLSGVSEAEKVIRTKGLQPRTVDLIMDEIHRRLAMGSDPGPPPAGLPNTSVDGPRTKKKTKKRAEVKCKR